MRRHTYTVSSAFPIAMREVITIRDGQGRAVERWTVRDIDPGKSTKAVTFDQEGYSPVDHL